MTLDMPPCTRHSNKSNIKKVVVSIKRKIKLMFWRRKKHSPTIKKIILLDRPLIIFASELISWDLMATLYFYDSHKFFIRLLSHKCVDVVVVFVSLWKFWILKLFCFKFIFSFNNLSCGHTLTKRLHELLVIECKINFNYRYWWNTHGAI